MSAPEPQDDVAGLRAAWLAACDRLEFAQDQGHSAQHMRELELDAERAYSAYEEAR